MRNPSSVFSSSTEIKAGFKHAIDRVKIAGWQGQMIKPHGSPGVCWDNLTSGEAAQMRNSVPKLLAPVLKDEEFILAEYPGKHDLRTRKFDQSSAVAYMRGGACHLIHGSSMSLTLNEGLE